MKPKNERFMGHEARLSIVEMAIIEMKDSFKKIDARFDKIDEKFDKIDERFEKIDIKFDRMDSKFEKLENKFDFKLNNLESRLWFNFFWLTGMMIGLAGLIAHAHQWI